MVEQITFTNRRGLRLVADHYPAQTDTVVVMAHGYTSHKRWAGRFPYIAAQLNQHGYAALAFDFAGCGDSDDDSLRADKLAQDVHAAVDQARAMGYQRIALWGHSLGARLCLMAKPLWATTMVLSGAGTTPMHYHWPDYYSAEELAELAATGRMTIEAAPGCRRQTQVVEAQMLRDFAEFEQAALLHDLPCPVLIVNGNHPDDAEECALLAGNRQGLHLLPTGSRHTVIEGARHNFADHLPQLAELGVAWIRERMPH